MERIEYIEINGTNYPLVCSLGAVEELSDAYGDGDKWAAKMKNATNWGVYLKTLAVFMKYGCLRAKRTEENVPDPLSLDDMRVIFDFDNYPLVVQKVNATMAKAQKNEIKGKAKGKKKETE